MGNKICVICIIVSAVLAMVSVFYNRRDDHKADAALFIAFAVIVFGVFAMRV